MTIYALKLLFPVLVMFGVFAALARPAFTDLLGADGYRKALTVMGVCTVAAFMGQDMRLVMILLGVIGLWASKSLGGGARGRLAAMLMLVLIMPPAHFQVEGFAGINRFVDLSAIRLLSLLLLPGLALRYLTTAAPPRPRWVVAVDWLFLGYQVLRLGLQFSHVSTTVMLRLAVETTLDLLLPYYVFSRAIRSRDDLRFILTHAVLAGTFAATVACAESILHRNLYEGLQWVYGYKWQLSLGLMRGEHLRTQAMTSQPILLAFELIFMLGLWTYLSGATWKRPRTFVVYALLAFALGSTWSRGPWLGALAFGMCLYGARKLSPRAFGTLLVSLLGVAVLAKVAGADTIVMNALGGLFGSDSADLSTIDYRRQLLDTALALIQQSPWIGVPDYASQMQSLKQGEGIIDLVNSYLAITLDAGLIGLVIYLLPYVVAISRLLGAAVPGGVAGQPDGPHGVAFGAVFAALSVALLGTIFTTSTFALMPLILTLLLALPVARLRMPAEEVVATPEPRSPIDLDRMSYGLR